MTSTLELIKSSHVLLERNFKVPSLDDVKVDSDGYTPIYNFQYVKHSLDLTIKVNVSQTGLNYDNSNNINYITIQNGDNGKKVGYFVVNKKWISEDTIQFVLRMDTINTFLNDIQLSDKTKILRQHKDRYRILGARQTVAVIRNIEAQPFTMSDFDTYELMVEDRFYIEQATSVEKTLIVNVADIGELPTISELLDADEFGIFLNTEEVPDLISVHYYVYTLDESHDVVRQIDEYTYSDFSAIISNGGTYKTISTPHQTIQLTSSEKFIAIRVVMTLPQPDEFTEIEMPYGLATSYTKDDITDEEYDELYDAINYIKNSLFSIGDYDNTLEDNLRIYPLIDRYSENINPMLYGRKLANLRESGYLDQSWYLIYMNQNAPTESLSNPVDCYVLPERKVLTKSMQTSLSLTFTGKSLGEAIFPVLNISSWDYYDSNANYNYVVLTPQNNSGCRIQITPANPSTASPSVDITMNSADNDMVVLMPIRDGVAVLIVGYGYSLNWFVYDANDSIVITNGKKAVQGYDIYGTPISEISNWPVFPMFATEISTTTIATIDDLDRTEPKLIKIIKLPYCPINCYIDSSGYLIYDQAQWQVSTISVGHNAFKFKNVNGTTFTRLMEFNGANVNPFAVLYYNLANESPTIYMEKSSSYETKLMHSEFYQPKVVYDSFGFVFQLELMNQYTDALANFRIQYDVSGSITSKFLFTFVDFNCTTTEVQDYNNIMYVSRNNDCVIYNQQYINYLRTGYNYDRESLDIKNQQLAVSTGYGGAVSITEKAFSGFKGGGTAGAIMSGGRAMMDFGRSIYEAVNDVKLAEMGLQAKQKALQNASTGVIDANDVDLMTAYTKNLLSYKLYKVSPRMEKCLFDMFYYTGYICGELGIPDTTSRCRFNYVSAEIVLKKVPNLSEEIIQDIKDRYASGITFLHQVYDAYEQKYVIDFDQHYENWENSILQALSH